MREGFRRKGDTHKPGLRLGFMPGDKVMINDDLEIEFIGHQGPYIRLLFTGDKSKWKVNRKPKVKE